MTLVPRYNRQILHRIPWKWFHNWFARLSVLVEFDVYRS